MNKDICKYISNISYAFDDGRHKDLICVEHRSNNPKRDYLFVNKSQCKHIPCKPSDMLLMVDDLASIVKSKLADDSKVLVIGFAETATGIGLAIADALEQCKYVMTTTREDVDNSVELINFEEEHSHATTQKLLFWEESDDTFLDQFNYILFVEDEISTGNTILNFIKAFERRFYKKLKFGVASVCNWQSTMNREEFENKDIDTFCLIRGELNDVNAKMDIASEDLLGEHVIVEDLFGVSKVGQSLSGGAKFKQNRLGRYTMWHGDGYRDEYMNYIANMNFGSKVRVIGTEECMYDAIKIGKYLEDKGCDVICHATTRSKIDVIKNSDNGLDSRVKLRSAYEDNRDTYLYNITNRRVDDVIVVTDSVKDKNVEDLIKDISNIFGCTTNNKIHLVRV